MSITGPESQEPLQQTPNDEGAPVTGNEQQTESINPAWNDLLESVPSVLHGSIIPHLKKWEDGVNQRFTANAAKYKDYDPIIESVGDAQTLDNAVKLMQALEADPKAVYDLLAQQYNFQVQPPVGQVAQPQVPAEVEYDDPQEKAIAELKTQIAEQQKINQQILQFFQTTQQQQQQQQQINQLNKTLERLHEANKDFDFDDNYVKAQIAMGMKPQDAVNQLKTMVTKYTGGKLPQLTPPSANDAPIVSGAGGGVPTQRTVNVAELSNRDTTKLVAQMLAAAAKESS